FGQNTPLKILNSCLIQTNGTILNQSSSFEVHGTNGGTFTINGGTFTQQGGLTVVTPDVDLLNGTVNATNATMNLGRVHIGDSSVFNSGNFYQSGGTVLSAGLRIHSGIYSLLDGTLYALDQTILDTQAAHFDQFGGTNYGDVHLDAGYY